MQEAHNEGHACLEGKLPRRMLGGGPGGVGTRQTGVIFTSSGDSVMTSFFPNSSSTEVKQSP